MTHHPFPQEDEMSEFFIQMHMAEEKYTNNPNGESMHQLLCYYTDCVNYFECKQESISVYFQLKIKELVRNVKQFGTKDLAEKNKEKLNQEIMKGMHQENIQMKIAESINREKRMNETVEKILKGQFEKLESRIRKSKRSMTKCHSVTMSFTSIESSPDRRMEKFVRGPLILGGKFVFSNDSEDDEEKTTS